MQGFNQFNLIENAHSKPSSEDNMIPLINIVFLLLIFFMVAGQIKAQPDQAITLPSTAQLETAQAQTLRLEMFADGQLKFNDETILIEGLEKKIDFGATGNLAVFADKTITAKQLDDILVVFANAPKWTIKLYTLEQS